MLTNTNNAERIERIRIADIVITMLSQYSRDVPGANVILRSSSMPQEIYDWLKTCYCEDVASILCALKRHLMSPI
jgi:hypothetical protein